MVHGIPAVKRHDLDRDKSFEGLLNDRGRLAGFRPLAAVHRSGIVEQDIRAPVKVLVFPELPENVRVSHRQTEDPRRIN